MVNGGVFYKRTVFLERLIGYQDNVAIKLCFNTLLIGSLKIL